MLRSSSDEAQQEAALSDIAILGAPCSAFSCALAIPSRPPVALGLDGSPKKSALCLMGSPSAFALRANRCCRRSCSSLCTPLLVDDLPAQPHPDSSQPIKVREPQEASCKCSGLEPTHMIALPCRPQCMVA